MKILCLCVDALHPNKQGSKGEQPFLHMTCHIDLIYMLGSAVAHW